MSRILKASYITMDNDSSVPIDNSLKISNELLTQKSEVNQEIHEQQVSQEDYFELEKEAIEKNREDILEAAREQGEQIIENAKNEAKSIIEQANLEIEEQANKIYQESQENGYKQGYEDGYSEAEELKSEANRLLLSAQSEKEQLEKQVEPEIVNLIIGISQKILTDSFKINPEIISLLIKKGLQNIKELKDIKICISENQYDFVLENKDSIIGVDTNKNNIQIIKDMSLEDDDCIIETEFGTIRCGVKEQFNGIKEALQYILG